MEKHIYHYRSGLLILTLGFLLFGFSSCSYKNIPYFTNVPDTGKVYQQAMVNGGTPYTPLIIRPDDILMITVSTLDNNLSILAPEGGATVSRSVNTVSTQSNIDGYLVSKDGNVELPLLGTLHLGGLNTSEAKELIAHKSSALYKDPVVNVRIMNFKVTVLGEVNKPGTYYVNSEKASVLDAIGLAGDLTIFGKRENVMLVRQEDGRQEIARYNLNDGQILSSPYFYLRQNDVIYVEPAKSKAASTDAVRTRNLSILTSVATIVAVILTRVNFK